MEHPLHIHGHSFNSLGIPNELNLKNPPLKDTLNIWPNAEQVIQWQATNPGTWIGADQRPPARRSKRSSSITFTQARTKS
jgi:hypothetical protein